MPRAHTPWAFLLFSVTASLCKLSGWGWVCVCGVLRCRSVKPGVLESLWYGSSALLGMHCAMTTVPVGNAIATAHTSWGKNRHWIPPQQKFPPSPISLSGSHSKHTGIQIVSHLSRTGAPSKAFCFYKSKIKVMLSVSVRKKVDLCSCFIQRSKVSY